MENLSFIPDAAQHAKRGFAVGEQVTARPLYFTQIAVDLAAAAGDQKIGYTPSFPYPHVIRGAKSFGYRAGFERRDAFLIRLQVDATSNFINPDFLPVNLLAGEFSDEYSPTLANWRPGKAISFFPLPPGIPLEATKRLRGEVINRTSSATPFSIQFASERLDNETTHVIPPDTQLIELVARIDFGVTQNQTLRVQTQRYDHDLLVLGGSTSVPDNPIVGGVANTDPANIPLARIYCTKNGESWSLDPLPTATFFAPYDAQETVLKYPCAYFLPAGSVLELIVQNKVVLGEQYFAFQCQSV